MSASTKAPVIAWERVSPTQPSEMRLEAALLTGGYDRTYACGLATALAPRGISLDVIGGDEVDSVEMHTTPGLTFLNLRRGPGQGWGKIKRVLTYYARLIRYAAVGEPKVFHILWNNKFEYFDRTILTLFYKCCGRKIVLTAHNINSGERDSNDSWLNRVTLRIQYHLADHIFVHTALMKAQLVRDFQVAETNVTVIPIGINTAVPDTDLTIAEARSRLDIKNGEKAVLFFGNIAPYKGVEYLITAFEKVASKNPDYRLIVAGPPKEGFQKYVTAVREALGRGACRERAITRIEFLPDDEIEVYFKAADVAVLPYTHIFQSGVLVLAYRFGLPVIAANVGSLREDVREGHTGFMFRAGDSSDLAEVLERYFAGELYRSLHLRRREIRDQANVHYSWDLVADRTRRVYQQLSQQTGYWDFFRLKSQRRN